MYVYVHVGVTFPFIHRLHISRLSNNVVSYDTLPSFCLSAVLYGGVNSLISACEMCRQWHLLVRVQAGILVLSWPRNVFEILDAGQLVVLPWFTHLSTQMPGTKDHYAN